jgi:hypothetical protein
MKGAPSHSSHDRAGSAPSREGTSRRHANIAPAGHSGGRPASDFPVTLIDACPRQLAPAATSLIFDSASSIVKLPGFCAGGKSLNVSANFAAAYCAA